MKKISFIKGALSRYFSCLKFYLLPPWLATTGAAKKFARRLEVIFKICTDIFRYVSVM